LAKCQFTTKYWEYESQVLVDYKCPDDEETLGSGCCIYHDENFLQDDNHPENKQKALTRLNNKITESVSNDKPLYCIGYHFPDNITIKRDFTKPVYFSKAKFQRINFSFAKFSGGVNFASAEFSLGVDFRSAKFSGGETFSLAQFSGEADFSSAEFSEKAYFFSAKFSGDSMFSSAEFSGEADFSSAKFSGEADFGSAKFSGEADFSSAEFSEKAYFFSAKFSGEANFIAKFSGEANFSSAKFYGGAAFRVAEFSEKADFASAEFSEKADFASADFSLGVDFRSAQFSGGADFSSAKFYGEANFFSAKFSEKADFSLAQFSGEADFYSAKFSEEADFSSNFFDKADFKSVLFEDGKKILFERVEDLSKFSFMNTDITRVRFSDRAKWGNEDKYTVTDEERLMPSQFPFQVSLGSVMAVYRNLRENYEYRLRYDEAGKFFIREMELKRKYREIPSNDSNSVVVKPNGWFRRNLSLTGVYYHLSRYGEDLLRPTLVGVVVVFLSTLFWLIQANPSHEPSFSHVVGFTQAGNETHWLKAFERSFADFLPLISLGSDIKVGIIDYIIKIVGGVLTFGLLVVALRRKFERKYTR
jgi:hypothetical protein